MSVCAKILKSFYEIYDIDYIVLIIVIIVEVSNIRTHSRKTNELRNRYAIGRGARNTNIKKWENNYFKNNIILFRINFR